MAILPLALTKLTLSRGDKQLIRKKPQNLHAYKVNQFELMNEMRTKKSLKAIKCDIQSQFCKSNKKKIAKNPNITTFNLKSYILAPAKSYNFLLGLTLNENCKP